MGLVEAVCLLDALSIVSRGDLHLCLLDVSIGDNPIS